MNIFVVIFSVYLIWLIVKALHMDLLSGILGHIMGVGVVAILIVFQQEIRKFLLLFVNKYSKVEFSLEYLFSFFIKNTDTKLEIKPILNACESMRKTKTGALIIIPSKSDLKAIVETGDSINSKITSQLLETIFFKNSPLHDGAVIIINNQIVAAGCILPITNRTDLPKEVGLRHRAAIGITENTDSIAVIVSEERGHISYSQKGKLKLDIAIDELEFVLELMNN